MPMVANSFPSWAHLHSSQIGNKSTTTKKEVTAAYKFGRLRSSAYPRKTPATLQLQNDSKRKCPTPHPQCTGEDRRQVGCCRKRAPDETSSSAMLQTPRPKAKRVSNLHHHKVASHAHSNAVASKEHHIQQAMLSQRNDWTKQHTRRQTRRRATTGRV